MSKTLLTHFMITRQLLVMLAEAGVKGMPESGPRQIHLNPNWTDEDLELPLAEFEQKCLLPLVELIKPYKVLGKAPKMPIQVIGSIETLAGMEIRYLEAHDIFGPTVRRFDFTTGADDAN